jgi:hypothetical protein
MPHANALIIAGKIPGAWLVQIKNAGHAVMDQYPNEISKILQTFRDRKQSPKLAYYHAEVRSPFNDSSGRQL